MYPAFVDDRGYTPLHVAVTSDNPSKDVIKALLQANHNVVMKKVIVFFEINFNLV